MKEPPNYRYVGLPNCCYTCEYGPYGECFITFECKLYDWPFANPNGLCDDWKGSEEVKPITIKEAATFVSDHPRALQFQEFDLDEEDKKDAKI